MKWIFSVFSAVLCLLLLASAIWAHPGRTDSAGGHTESATGEYHYHHGYPEHQHYDADGDGTIDCPYEFQVNESNSSGSISNYSESDPNYSTASSEVLNNAEPIESSSDPMVDAPHPNFWKENATLLIPFIVLIILVLYVVISIHRKNVAEKEDLERRIRERRNSIAASEYYHRKVVANRIFYNLLNDEYNKLCKRQKALIGQMHSCITSPTEIIDLPENTSVDSHGMPYGTILAQKKDDPYLFSLSDSGVYHKASCRYASTYKYINAAQLVYRTNRLSWHRRSIRPCTICNPNLPDLSWLISYRRISNDLNLLKSITSHQCEQFYLYANPITLAPYHKLLDFIYAEDATEIPAITKKLICWFELDDAKALLKYLRIRHPAPTPILIEAIELFCENYEDLDRQRKYELEQKTAL